MSIKDKVRKKFLLLRKSKYFIFDDDIFKPLINLIKLKKKRKISLYYPSNFEADTLKLFKILEKDKKLHTSLPSISSKYSMKFLRWKLNDPLKVNKYGFLEPITKEKKVNPDLIVVPVVAFDRFNNRLGYGKGYYDKFLGKYLKKRKKIITVGLAFSFQKYKKIPATKFDVKLDYILTEKGIFKLK
tara:strand:- start:4804 stop:5361 length:558 start_codon:yes stop_codon:yes gene_type:complete